MINVLATVMLYPMLFSFKKLYTDTVFMVMPQKFYLVADFMIYLLTCKHVMIESFFTVLIVLI